MKIRRLFYIFLALAMFFGSFVGAEAATASQSADLMVALGVFPADTSLTAVVKRADLADVAAKLLKLDGALSSGASSFDDIPNDSPFAGVANALKQLKIMQGTGGGNFSPSDPITLEQVAKVAVLLLGYPEQSMEDYYLTAVREGIFSGISAGKAGINYGELAKILENTVTAAMTRTTYSADGNTYSKPRGENYTFLGQYLKIERYKAKIISVDTKSGIMRVEIISDRYSEGILGYKAGSVVSVRAGKLKNPLSFLGKTGLLWIDEDENAVCFRTSADDGAFWSYIFSANRDEEQSLYFGAYLTEIYTNGATYKFAPSYSVYYNNENAYGLGKIYAQRPARVIVESDRITSLEVFDPVEGGIISAVTSDRLFYTHGGGDKKYIDNIEDYTNKYIIIDNDTADYEDLAEGMLADYLVAGDTLYIFASSYVISDVLESVSDDAISVGSALYDFSGVYPTYYSNKYGVFSGDADAFDLLNKNAKIYLDGLGMIRYIQADSSYDKTGDTEFYGFLSGVAERKDAFGSKKAKIFKVVGNKSEEIILNIADKTIIPADFAASAGKRNNSSLWIFRTNSNGEIREILRPEDIKSVLQFKIWRVYVDGNRKAFGFDYDGSYMGRRLGYLPVGDASYVGLVEYSGIFKAVTAPFGEFGGEIFGEGVSCAVYKNPMDKEAEMVVFWHETKPHSFFVSYEATPAIVKKVAETVDKNGDTTFKLTLWLGDGTTETRYVNEETRKFVNDDYLIYYRLRVMYSESSFVLSQADDSFGGGVGPGQDDRYSIKNLADKKIYDEAIDVRLIPNQTLDFTKKTIYKGTVYKRDGYTVWFDDSDDYAFQFKPQCLVLKLDGELKRGDLKNIQSGETIYFYVNSLGDIDYVITK